MKMESIPQHSLRMLAVVLCGTLLVLELFVFFSSNTSPQRMASPPQRDTLIYMQYARAIAEGHPYRFIPGDAPTTASTSHLYPLVLAIPYALGAQGEALYVVSLVFNILFLALIVALVWVIACRIAPAAAGYAAGMTALSGPLAYAVLQQSDMGCFTVLLLAFFAAMLYERHWVAALFLALSVWCRPDGFVVSVATLGYGLFAEWQPQRRRIQNIGWWGCGNVLAVLLLNKLLTGAFLFESLSGKGYFAKYPFAGAVVRMIADLGALTHGFLLGLGSSDRQLYTLPLIGGLLALAGLFGRLVRTEDRSTAADGCWALGTLGVLGLVAASGWQGFQHDRHLSWLFPFLALYMAAGLLLIKQALPRWRAWHLVGVSVLLYQAATLPLFAVDFARNMQHTATNMALASKAHQTLPPDKRIMVITFSGAAYLMPGRSFTSVDGYTSPRFMAWRDNQSNIELLRHRPELRGDYWLTESVNARDAPLCAPFVGRAIMAESVFPPIQGNVLTLYEADWSALTSSCTPLTTNALAAVKGWQLVDALDVGYVADETAHAYCTRTRVPNLRLSIFGATGIIEGRKVTEAARLVLGCDQFRIHAEPGHDVRLVMRTTTGMLDKNVKFYDTACDASEIRLDPSICLHVEVDGMDAGIFPIVLSAGDTSWSEVVIDLPGTTIRRSHPEITLEGDHVAAGYWFYQKL